MPDKFSVDTGSDHNGRTIPPWFAEQLEWPYERVVVELEVVAPRELTPFEWVIERVLSEFPIDPPTLEQLADELGIKAPVFLRETLESLIQIAAVEQKNREQPLELSNAALTTLGEQLLREGRVASLPEHHGMHLYLDAVTGEDVVRISKTARRKPSSPIIEPSQLLARTEVIGLDRVREISRARGEPFHQGDSRISAVNIRVEEGHHLWLPVRLLVGVDREGVLRARIESGSQAQQAWFEEHGWALDLFSKLGSASTAGWANGRCRNREAPVTATEWLNSAERLVPPRSTVNEACHWISNAASEVILHTGWLDAAETQKALESAAHRGVRCYVCGTEPAITNWSPRPDTAPGFIAGGGQSDVTTPLGLIVDNSRALCIDRVCARGPAGQEIDIEAAAVLRSSHVPILRERLVTGIPADLLQEDQQHLFAGFALTRDQTLWQQGVREIRARTSGIEQVRELRQWGQWAESLWPENEPSGDWLAPAVEAWWAVLEASQYDHTELMELAVGLIAPGEILSNLARKIGSSPVWQDAGPFCELLMLAADIRRRWPGFNPIRDCPILAQSLRACLRTPDQDSYERGVAAAVTVLSADPRFQAEIHACAEILSSVIPAPLTPESFLDWLEAHEPLGGHLDGAFQKAAQQHLYKLQGQLRALRDDLILDRIQQAWRALGLPPGFLRRLTSSGLQSRRSPAVARRRA